MSEMDWLLNLLCQKTGQNKGSNAYGLADGPKADLMRQER
jgi:hypothetical protein